MDDVTWTALTLTLTVLFGVGTWIAYQRRGLPAGLKGAGITLLPLAAYLTDTLRMFTRIVTAVGDWATGLVFSPTVWIGVVVAGLGVLLFGAGRALETRRAEKPVGPGTQPKRTIGRAQPSELPAAPPAKPKQGKPAGDDELDEIEELLRRRGIT